MDDTSARGEPGGELEELRRRNRDLEHSLSEAEARFQRLLDESRAQTTQLERIQAMLKAAVDQSPAGILIADADNGQLRVANAAALGIQGSTSPPLSEIPMSLRPESWKTFHPDGQPMSPEELPLSRALQTGEPCRNVEIIIERADGERRWVLANAAPVKGADGSVVAGIVIFPDITERKRAEAARDLLEMQLHQARKMEAIGRLAGGVAHDFNNLLTGILVCSDLLLSEIDPTSSQCEDVKDIRLAAERGAELTNRMLIFSKNKIIEPRLLSLNEVLDNAQRMIARIIGEDVQLRFNPGQDLWSVYVAPEQIDQIFLNVATNSRDAMPDGGRIDIETRNVTLGDQALSKNPLAVVGDYVLLQVRDDGVGMDDETQEHLFEPFYSTKDAGLGTGLGLSTVYGILLQSGGFVEVTSAPGQGTELQIYFPRADGDAASAGVESADGEASCATSPNTGAACRGGETIPGGETILLVEDDPTVRTLATRILKSAGYVVLAAPDGPQGIALEASGSNTIDLLLTDVIMPYMNGADLYDQLSQRRPGLRVLYMSGYTDEVIARHGVLAEGTRFLSKPFVPKQLLGAVLAALTD